MPPVSNGNGNGRWLFWLAGIIASVAMAWAGWQHCWNGEQDVRINSQEARLTATERRVEDNLSWIRESLKRIEERQTKETRP